MRRAPFHKRINAWAVAVTVLASCLAGCATTPPSTGGDVEVSLNDPLEDINRPVFDFNQFLDAAVLKPVAEAYVWVMPDFARTAVSNVLTNLREPFSFQNDVLQARACHATESLVRFAVNSTVGVAGIFDVAGDHLGLPHHDNDFGLTFADWGIPDGPYLVLPLLGPSNLRDATGTGLEWFAEPVDLALSAAGANELIYLRAGMEAVDTRVDMMKAIDHLNSTSLDPYAAYRSAARQSRTRQMRQPPCRL